MVLLCTTTIVVKEYVVYPKVAPKKHKPLTIIELIETHKALFEDTDTENTLNYITKDNVKMVLERVAEVLGKDEKGFYASRLKQCINKLK